MVAEQIAALGYTGDLAEAVRSFQQVHGLEPTGIADASLSSWLDSGDAWPAPLESPSINLEEAKVQVGFLRALLAADEEHRREGIRRGLLHFGLRFLSTLDLMREGGAFKETGEELSRMAQAELASWLGGARLSGEPDEDERRAAAAHYVLESRPQGWAVFPLCADAILHLPEGHPHRDETLARRAVRFALRRAEVSGRPETFLWAARRALENGYGTTAECDAWLDTAERLATQHGDTGEQFHLWSAACGYAGQLPGEERALRYQANMAACAQTAIQRALAWIELFVIHVKLDEQSKAADCLEAALAENALGLDVQFGAAVKCARVRYGEGQYDHVTALIEPLWDALEAWYLDGVGNDEVTSRGGEFKEACDLMAMSAMRQDRWPDAVLALERAQGRRFRREVAIRRNAAVRAAEAAVRAAEQGAPIAGEERGERESDWLGYRLTDVTRARQAYWDARAAVPRNPEPKVPFSRFSEALDDGEALVILGLHWSGTLCAVIGTADRERPSGRFYWPECTQRWLINQLAGEGGQFLSEIESGAAPDGLGLELDKLRAELDARLANELGGWLQAQGFRRIAIVPHGFYRMVPLWTLPSLERFDVRVLGSAREILRVEAGVEPKALIAANPCGDLPLAEFEADAVCELLARKGFSAQSICGAAAGEAEIAAAVEGCGLFHFSGHGLQKMDDALRSALLMAPQWKEAGLAGPEDLHMLAAEADWTVESEESRKSVLKGKGLLREVRDLETGDLQRWLDYSVRGSVWARFAEDQPIQWGELWTAADMLADERLSGLRLAVLSACSSGIEAIPFVEEPGGLPGALKAAGLRSLVSAFWPVTQELAWLFTEAFYEALDGPAWDLAHALRATRERIRSMAREEAANRLRRVATQTEDLWRRMYLDVAVCRLEEGPAMPFAQAVQWGAFFLQGDARVRIRRET